ncbi:hypothetical protein OPT61_g4873 [Boeremia exigua]|uniref:Uncharacterized protein n=1 Tax=Boeremia exigua TaxID=749465 RepID=A0ACC2ICG2_9PLEO|nr:hypothetical protein OPT61_g4873 [Boeremia exigua]
MTDTKMKTPAQWVGGQRRKLVRRNRVNPGPPRSSTMPILNPESATASLVSSINSLGNGYTNRQSEDTHPLHQVQGQQESEDVEGKMSGAPYFTFAGNPVASSSRLTAADSKKKQGLFGTKKPKALDHPTSSAHTQVLVSPLPASTPTKAAKFFGLESKPAIPESPRRARFQDDGDTDEVQGRAPVRPALKKQFSLPLLTRLKLGTDKKGRAEEDTVQQDEPKSSNTGRAVTTKGLRMLIPEFAGPRRSPIEQATAATARLNFDDEDDGYDSDSQFQGSQVRVAPRLAPAVPKRLPRRKKTAKVFERMSPITEASSESLRPNQRGNEELTQLDAISEHAYDDHPYSTEHIHGSQSRNAAVLPRSHTETMLPLANRFTLDEADLSPMDEYYDEDEIEDDGVVHPGTRVNLKDTERQQGDMIPIRGLLQSLEDTCLDVIEEQMRLKSSKEILARVEAEKQAMDAQIAVLRREHEQLKLQYDANIAAGYKNLKEASDDDDDDLVSLRSSIDLDEEPTLHEAKSMTFTRVTPGIVKLVDIPPRKKKPVAQTGSSSTIPDQLEGIDCERKGLARSSPAENVLPPFSAHYHYDYTDKPKKSKLARDESRTLVQNWVSDYNSTEQRPISTRVDPDVLADQETPPAPFPKSDEALPTPPIKTSSGVSKTSKSLPKHLCINNGHIFHPVDLKTMPDDAVVNSLEVRPYLQTYTGLKQHVKIPVLCEKCCKDCDENVWECEIAVCRMAVCQSCAEGMEVEWQQRAVGGWKYNQGKMSYARGTPLTSRPTVTPAAHTAPLSIAQPTMPVASSSIASRHPKLLPGAQLDYPNILIRLIRGPVVKVVVGTLPAADTYNLPAELLRWHSVYFESEIGRLKLAAEASGTSKKRKLCDEDESTVMVKVEGDADEHTLDAVDAHDVLNESNTIELPTTDPKIFEMFMKFAYMGFYPFEVDTPQSVIYKSPYEQKSTNSYVPATSPTPASRQNGSQTSISVGSMAPPSVPYPKISITKSPKIHDTPYQSIPPSIHAWLLGATLGAARFMNHAMLHIHSGMGEYFSLTPNLIDFIWRRTTHDSPLRKLITDVLTAYWAEPEPGRAYISRHLALNASWMKLFDVYVDLKSIVLLGVRGTRALQPCGAYFVYPRMSASRAMAGEKGRKVGSTAVASKGTEVGAKEKVKRERGSSVGDAEEIIEITEVRVVDGEQEGLSASVAGDARV